MNLLNKLGTEVLDLKTALMGNNYPDIVIRSLEKTARHEFLDKELLTDEEFKQLMQTDCSIEAFQELVLSLGHFVKSVEELEAEYSAQRDKIMLYLGSFAETAPLQVSNHLEKELIAFTKTFTFGGAEMKEYFGVGQEAYEPLMKRKGFVEKFFALRYPLILKSYLQSLNLDKEVGLNLSISPVFFDEESANYGIDFNVEVPLALLESERPDELAEVIKNLVEGADEYVAARFVI